MFCYMIRFTWFALIKVTAVVAAVGHQKLAKNSSFCNLFAMNRRTSQWETKYRLLITRAVYLLAIVQQLRQSGQWFMVSASAADCWEAWVAGTWYNSSWAAATVSAQVAAAAASPLLLLLRCRCCCCCVAAAAVVAAARPMIPGWCLVSRQNLLIMIQ